MSDKNVIEFPTDRPSEPPTGGGPPMNTDTRLRSAENDLSIIKERLNHMPTTAQMYRWVVGTGAGAVIILGGMLLPILGKVMGWW